MALFLPCLYAFLACLGFCVLFRIRGLGAVLCSLGGALAWLVYLVSGPLSGGSVFLQSFYAAVFLSAWSEAMARLRKCPATGYQLIAFIPLVPGVCFYCFVDHRDLRASPARRSSDLTACALGGALAVGVLVVSSLVRMFSHRRRPG